MGYFNTTQLENDDYMTLEYADRLTLATRRLDVAVCVYHGRESEATRERLIKAALAYQGAQRDMEFVVSAAGEARTNG